MATDQSHSLLGQAVGAKIRAARQALKYTQSQLAGKDFSVSYISAIERGQIHPSLRALEIFAIRLGLSSKDLFLPQTGGGGVATPTRRDMNSEEEVEWRILIARV